MFGKRARAQREGELEPTNNGGARSARQLSHGESPWQYGKLFGFAKGSHFGGAVTEGD